MTLFEKNLKVEEDMYQPGLVLDDRYKNVPYWLPDTIDLSSLKQEDMTDTPTTKIGEDIFFNFDIAKSFIPGLKDEMGYPVRVGYILVVMDTYEHQGRPGIKFIIANYGGFKDTPTLSHDNFNSSGHYALYQVNSNQRNIILPEWMKYMASALATSALNNRMYKYDNI